MHFLVLFEAIVRVSGVFDKFVKQDSNLWLATPHLQLLAKTAKNVYTWCLWLFDLSHRQFGSFVFLTNFCGELTKIMQPLVESKLLKLCTSRICSY
jgi:hypothetical protein